MTRNLSRFWTNKVHLCYKPSTAISVSNNVEHLQGSIQAKLYSKSVRLVIFSCQK
jgi:hypothetical protein